MKSLLFTILILLSTTGCVESMVYSTVADERGVGTITKDKLIENSILAYMLQEKSSDILDVTVTSYEGDVFLVGEYETNSQKDRLLASAKKVDGVKSVKSHLVKAVKNHACGTTENLAITAEVKAKLIKDTDIWSTNVNVSTIQCQVVLWGTVGKAIEVSKSIIHAKSIDGVKSVKSFLKAKR